MPPDLQKIVRDDAAKVSKDIVPFVKEFFAKQRDIWKSKGGVLISLPAEEQAAMLAKVSSIGEDLSKDKPDLNKAVKLVFESAKRKQVSRVRRRAPNHRRTMNWCPASTEVISDGVARGARQPRAWE